MPSDVKPYYRHTPNRGSWMIEQDHLGRWLLKRLTTAGWMPVNSFDTAEQAATAVGLGDTGDKLWDKPSHNPDDYDLSKWDREKKGSWPG